MLKINTNVEQRNVGWAKDDKNYYCLNAAGQAMLLQMHLLAAVFLVRWLDKYLKKNLFRYIPF